MAWVRVEENAIYNTKVMALSHGAFRLWHEGLAYCQRELTNGFISRAALKAFRYYSTPRASELSTPIEEGRNPLWMSEGDGFRLNDYLTYNDERDRVIESRAAARERMRLLRAKRDASFARTLTERNANNASTNAAPIPPRHDTTPLEDRKPARAAALDGFVEFYAGYPRHVAKGDAEKAWHQVKADSDLALRVEIMAALQRQIRQGFGREKKFTPFPGTWLRARRWEDETADVVRDGRLTGDTDYNRALRDVKANGCPHNPTCEDILFCVNQVVQGDQRKREAS